MSRSGYSDDGDLDQWAMIRWRGAVTAAFKGKRGQAFLREMLAALDAMPEKRLIENELEAAGEVCALGAVGRARGMDMTGIDPEDHDQISGRFGITHALACEIMFYNDEGTYRTETPEARFTRMRAWIVSEIRPPPSPQGGIG